jgi:hypothetical protein
MIDIGDENSKFSKVAGCASEAEHDELARNLMNAYVACLSFDDPSELAVVSLSGLTILRRAVRNRLRRVAGHSASCSQLDMLASTLLGLSSQDRRSRTAVDTLLSELYTKVSPPVRQRVLQHWVDAGTRTAAARWLKAIEGDGFLFEASQVFAYWRKTRDARAARVLSLKADPDFLASILSELVHAVDEGWIISRAATRVGSMSEEDWLHLRDTAEATYLYLCAKLKRSVEDAEAVRLVRRMRSTFLNERGLAIWSLGEMGLVRALDEIHRAIADIRADDHAALQSERHYSSTAQ